MLNGQSNGGDPPHWRACYTRARHEKSAERQLAQRGFSTYLPTLMIERQWKDRKKLVEFPLFSSYVFARFRISDVHDVLTVPGISTIVRMDDRPVVIPDWEMENLRKFVVALRESGVKPELRPLVEKGARVRVTEGPFRGVEGIVVEHRGHRRVLVGLSAIKQALEVDVAVETIERIQGGQSGGG